jgi:hypothetical protein
MTAGLGSANEITKASCCVYSISDYAALQPTQSLLICGTTESEINFDLITGTFIT